MIRSSSVPVLHLRPCRELDLDHKTFAHFDKLIDDGLTVELDLTPICTGIDRRCSHRVVLRDAEVARLFVEAGIK